MLPSVLPAPAPLKASPAPIQCGSNVGIKCKHTACSFGAELQGRRRSRPSTVAACCQPHLPAVRPLPTGLQDICNIALQLHPLTSHSLCRRACSAARRGAPAWPRCSCIHVQLVVMSGALRRLVDWSGQTISPQGHQPILAATKPNSKAAFNGGQPLLGNHSRCGLCRMQVSRVGRARNGRRQQRWPCRPASPPTQSRHLPVTPATLPTTRRLAARRHSQIVRDRHWGARPRQVRRSRPPPACRSWRAPRWGAGPGPWWWLRWRPALRVRAGLSAAGRNSSAPHNASCPSRCGTTRRWAARQQWRTKSR